MMATYSIRADLPDGWCVTSPPLPTFRVASKELDQLRSHGGVAQAVIVPHLTRDLGPDEPTIWMDPLAIPEYMDRPADDGISEPPEHLQRLPRTSHRWSYGWRRIVRRCAALVLGATA